MRDEYDGRAIVLDDSIRQWAVQALTDLGSWRLRPGAWEQVARALTVMATAVTAGDALMVERATVDLEILSPLRTHKVGDLDEPPPKDILDEVVILVHALGGTTENAAQACRNRDGKAAEGLKNGS